MSRVQKEIVYSQTVYNIYTDSKIPYQLSFERDFHYDRINVYLIPLVNPQKKHCSDLKELVVKSFMDYFRENPDETIYLDFDIYHSRNQVTLYKFFKWMEKHIHLFNIRTELTMNDSILYLELYITKI